MIWDLLYSIVLALSIFGAVIVIVADDGDSGRKLAWLLVITVLPVIGLILYLAIGINYRRHWIFNRMHQRYLDIFYRDTDSRLNDLIFGHSAEEKVRERYRGLARLLGNEPAPTVSSGNDLEIITVGKRKYELLMEDIRNAREYIHMEYFLFGDDAGGRAVRSLLMEKAREGVKVRFLHENIANFTIRPKYYNDMRKAGVEVVKFTNPRKHLLNLVTRLNYRNHRKIVVIDGKIGFTGGMNISDKYFFRWRDTHLRITGPAVASLQHIFMDSWLTAGGTIDRKFIDYFLDVTEEKQDSPHIMRDGGNPVLKDKLVQVVPDEPDTKWPLIQYSYEWAIHHARKYIYLQTPYFIPPESILNALKIAALSGVDVRLMIPEKADAFYMGPANKSYFKECLDSGIRIYQRKEPFIHAKTFVSDDYLTSIGTANMDFRSFNINYEVNTYIYDEETALQYKQIFLEDIGLSREVNSTSWDSRPIMSRIIQSIVRLVAPML